MGGLIITIRLIIHENDYDTCARVQCVFTTVERIGQVYYLMLTYKTLASLLPHMECGGLEYTAQGYRGAGFESLCPHWGEWGEVKRSYQVNSNYT